jgi:nitrite reductase/ring-hydroxylating ferredoxin subunit
MEERSGEAVRTPDFTGCAHCAEQSGTSRRDFLAKSAASAVAALLVTACGGGASDFTGVNTGPVSLSVQVSSYAALANVGGIAQVDNGGTPIAAVRTGANSFAAFSLICPHNGCTVGITGSSFQCPCHNARFASNGAWTGGQRTSNLQSLTTSYDATTGVLTITS